MSTRHVHALLLLAGCTQTDSDAVTTANLRADIQVTSTKVGASTVSVSLLSHRAGDPPLNFETIRLVGDDQLWAAMNGQEVAMNLTNLVVEYQYSAVFETTAPDQSFEIRLERTTDTSAPHSTVTLPPPFEITAPTTASRAAPLTIAWSPSSSDDLVSIQLTGCGSAQLGPMPDTGSATFPADAISQGPANTTCDLEVSVERTRMGVLDAGYGQGGSISALQRRTGTLTSTP